MIENWDRSKELLARARQSLAGGVSSPFRAKAPVPLYFEDGCGPRLRDVDGNEYIDYQLAWGPMILGYKHPKLVEAMRRQAELPACYGAQHELEISVAEKIQGLVLCAERVAFTSSGSEAVQVAQRLARAFTCRRRRGAARVSARRPGLTRTGSERGLERRRSALEPSRCSGTDLESQGRSNSRGLHGAGAL